MTTYLVNYQVATYAGSVCVTTDETDTEIIIAKAKAIVRRQCGPLPIGYESWNIVDSQEAANA